MAFAEKISFLCILLCVEIFVFGQLDVGDPCGPNRDKKCLLVENCPPAIELIKQRRHNELERCGWEGKNEIVCCKTDIADRTSLRAKSEKACMEYWKVSKIDSSPFIFNGDNATLGQFPHQAALGYEKDADGTPVFGDCGGSLISKNFVLTAAHCVLRIDGKEPVAVRLGKIDLQGDEDGVIAQDIRVAKVIPHPEYQHFQKLNDIALLQLEKDVEINKNVKPICLYPEKTLPNNTGLIISGWGKTEKGKASRFLLGAFVKAVDPITCNKTFSELALNKPILDSHLCALSAESVGSDTCQGDSGGPLQIENRKDNQVTPLIIVGITSYGRGCGGRTPSIYTRVSSYMNWIEEIVW